MPREKVLIIEDDDNLQEALRYRLEQDGYVVHSAMDGEEGLDLAREVLPDLIILDIMLPVLDGLEVCRIIRQETAAPIIMLTAKGEEVDRVVGLELGADDYVVKPFSTRELLARMRAVRRRARSGGEALPAADTATVLSGRRSPSQPFQPHRKAWRSGASAQTQGIQSFSVADVRPQSRLYPRPNPRAHLGNRLGWR